MPFRFTCPHCQATTDVEDQYAGQSGACWNCGDDVVLPALEPDVFRAEVVDAQTATVQDSAADTQQPVADRARTILQQQSKHRNRACLTRLAWLGGIVLAGAIVWLIIRSLDSSIGLLAESDEMRARKNLARIGAAMQMYHDEHGSFPPAYIADENGKPKHSWRVLLLPYLGERDLYNQYNFNEPWDGEANTFLLPRMPRVFSSEYIEQYSAISETSYMVVVGPGTAFPGSGTTTLEDLTDGSANTILVVEVEANGTSWLEPVDLDATAIDYSINGAANGNPGQVDGIGSSRNSSQRDGALVVTVDGTVHELADSCPPEIVKSFVTIAGGEADLIESAAE